MLRLIDSPDELAGLGAPWAELYRRCDTNLFLTHGWIANWARCFAPRMTVAVELRGSRLEAALPVWRDGGVWRSLGDHSYRPSVLAARPPGQVLGPMIRALDRRAGGPVVLEGTAAGGDLEAAGTISVVKHQRCLRVVDTSVSFDDFLAARRKKVRQELGRKRRKLERELADPALRVWRGGAMDEAFAAVLEVERDSWKDGAATSIGSSIAEERFYRGVLELGGDDTEPSVYALFDGAQPIAFVLGVAHRETYYALKCSYRESFARLSPGSVLFTHLIEAACADPALERLELLGVDARWKRELADREDPIAQIELRPRNLRALAYAVGYERVRPAIKSLLARSPRLSRLWERMRG